MKVTLVRVTENPLMASAEAASNCYNSEPTIKIVNHCYNSGHTSILEFADFHFHIEGVSRALLAQITRHRIANFAVRSQRYCIEDNFRYVFPPSIKNIDLVDEYNAFMESAQNLYNKLIDNGVPAEDARFVLPNACETKLDVKMNLRSLINFMKERLCTRSQWEIRKLAQEMKRVVLEYEPNLEKFLVPKCERYTDMPFCNENNSCGKHPKLKEIYKTFYNS